MGTFRVLSDVVEASALVVEVVIGVLLNIAGWAKLLGRGAALDAMRNFGFGTSAPFFAIALPVAEIAIGVALVAGFSLPQSLTLASLLFLGFAGVVVASVMRGADHDCNCFGSMMQSRVGWPLAYRNAACAGLCVAVALIPTGELRYELFASSLRLLVGQTLGFLVLITILSLVIQASTLILLQRTRNGSRPARALPGTYRPLIPPKTLVPNLLTMCLTGRERPWRDMLNGKDTLLLFANPRCSGCRQLLLSERFVKATRDVSIVVVSRGDVETNRLLFESLREIPIKEVVLQQGNEIALVFGVQVTPAAYFVSHEGRITSSLLVGELAIASYLESHQGGSSGFKTVAGMLPG